MAKYTVFEAKTHLSKLLRKAARGEDVVILNRNVPVARVVPVKGKRRAFGSLKGKVKLAKDFDAALKDFREYMK
jgi:prevent-host-death family protein